MLMMLHTSAARELPSPLPATLRVVQGPPWTAPSCVVALSFCSATWDLCCAQHCAPLAFSSLCTRIPACAPALKGRRSTCHAACLHPSEACAPASQPLLCAQLHSNVLNHASTWPRTVVNVPTLQSSTSCALPGLVPPRTSHQPAGVCHAQAPNFKRTGSGGCIKVCKSCCGLSL